MSPQRPQTMAVPNPDVALRRRLSDSRGQRWLWALLGALPVVGLPALLWHGVRRRTAIPFLYGLTCQAIGAFSLATVATTLWSPQQAIPNGRAGELTAAPPRPDGLALMLVLAASGCFALGHRQGQEKAARDAAAWLRLDG